MLHDDTHLNKASPIKCLEFFLQQYSPQCENERVFVDQDEELYPLTAWVLLYSTHRHHTCNF